MTWRSTRSKSIRTCPKPKSTKWSEASKRKLANLLEYSQKNVEIGKSDKTVQHLESNYVLNTPLALKPLNNILEETGDDDPAFDGYYALYVGDPEEWLSIVIEDEGYSDDSMSVLEFSLEDAVTFDDPNSGKGGDALDANPDSTIVVFNKPFLPASKITVLPLDPDWPTSRPWGELDYTGEGL